MNTQTETKALTVTDWQNVVKDAARQEETILQSLKYARARRIGAEAALAALDVPADVASSAPAAVEAPAPAKRGRKPGTKVVKAAAKTAAKTAQKAKANAAKPAKASSKTAPKTAKAKTAPKTASKAAEKSAKVSKGGQDNLQIRISRAIGTDECKADDVVERLKKTGQAPKSGNLRAYISMNMSTSKLLEKVSWGVYKNTPETLAMLAGSETASAKAPVPATKTNGKTNGKKKAEAQAESKTDVGQDTAPASASDEVEVDLQADPFAL